MGDRNNPIKFGPEWLRNLARERYAGGTAATNQNAAAQGGGGGASGAATASPSTPPATATSTANTMNTNPKVQLAKLRYGREEMLALYDRTSQAPSELKFIDILYQPRGKQPFALSSSFDDDMRDTMRSSPLTGPMPAYAMFSPRGIGRGMNVCETRGRVRLPFLRSPVTGRGTFRHLSNPRMPGYSGGAEDDAPAALRSWNNSNGGNVSGKVGNSDQAEWSENKMYRSKRTGTNTNWRQSTRDDEEWRASDGNRSRQSGQQEKWERDWNDKTPQDRQSWSSNRRTWVGNESQNNDDNLPEWAVDGAEACGGTFDASGAFHGYSNDDSNLPKSPDSSYALTRSHTHGSFVRSKTVEEGSEEWWASEKAKKLSPKRFDASDIKFKKSNSVIPELSSGTGSNSKSNEEPPTYKGHEKLDTPGGTAVPTEQPDNNGSSADDNFNKRNVRFAESKTFDALMRSDINLEEASDERGNFQSVMITPNNSLRQKHQNIVSSANNYNKVHPKLQYILSMQNSPPQNVESELSKQSTVAEDKMVDLMELTLEDKEITSKLSLNEGPVINTSIPMSSTMSAASNTVSQINSPAMHLRMSSPIHPTQGLAITHKSSITSPGPQPTAMPTPGIQNVGITSSALNASLGLPLGPPNNAMNQAMSLPLQGVPPPILPNPGIANAGVGANVMQGGGQGITGYQANVVNSALFLGQNKNAPPLQSTNEMPLNHGNQFPIHGLQHTGSQAAFNSSIYSNIMQQTPASNPPNPQSLVDQWYYEDPKGEIQGPFSSKEMYNWYQAGFFSPSLMVRRACDVHMRPLGSYGPVVPFQPMDMLSPYPMSSGFDSRAQGPHESMLAPQPAIGLDVINMTENNPIETMQFGTVGLINRNQPFGQQPMVESLWSQPTPSPDLLWVQQAINARNETRVNNLPMMFWDQQPSAITSNSLLPEEIAKEMKTEDQILAQLRASQKIHPPQKLPFVNEAPPNVPTPPASKPDDVFSPDVAVTPNLEALQKLIKEDPQKDETDPSVMPAIKNIDNDEQTRAESAPVDDQSSLEINNGKTQTIQNRPVTDLKTPKLTKNESEKAVKNKENNAKSKISKKSKEDKREDSEVKTVEEEVTKTEKRLEESSPSKNKKDLNKKELEKEKKEWIKEGFTIVKADKNSKDNKKKLEEIKAAEEVERKRREEERLIFEEEKKRRQAEALKKQQEMQQQQQPQPQPRQAAELVMKKAPWSAVSNQTVQATSKDGLTLAEIQRLEREKKLEQMKEQQQMMLIIAQQQAAALAREQEMQAGLGWAKKKANMNATGQSLAEIQAEARKQAAAASASQVLEEIPVIPQPQPNHAPWGSSHNGGGFWDTPPNQSLKSQEATKTSDPAKQKKKPTVQPMKKELTPAAEFEIWCTTILTSWSAKIDIPTFVGFLKDIESPYEVKDYVKCYLGDSKESSDFSRQFLERRSKLLRVGMVTPSDDLCSPAIAVNPRTASGSDYQEVKSKAKKTKKSKMFKVDNRILGFSVTAAEDRINVGDIDTA